MIRPKTSLGGGLAVILTVPRSTPPPTLWPQALAHLILVFSQAPQHLRPSLTPPPGSWGPNSPGPKGHLGSSPWCTRTPEGLFSCCFPGWVLKGLDLGLQGLVGQLGTRSQSPAFQPEASALAGGGGAPHRRGPAPAVPAALPWPALRGVLPNYSLKAQARRSADIQMKSAG